MTAKPSQAKPSCPCVRFSADASARPTACEYSRCKCELAHSSRNGGTRGERREAGEGRKHEACLLCAFLEEIYAFRLDFATLVRGFQVSLALNRPERSTAH
jgi:hypothetical protein